MSNPTNHTNASFLEVNHTNASFLEVPFVSSLSENQSFYRTNAGFMEVPFPDKIDSIIFQHMREIRLELEEWQKQQTRLIIMSMWKKLREKDEQIKRIEELNLALQESLKRMLLENQIWKDIAQSNESTLNSLCMNLEQAVVKVDEEDAESCCSSSDKGMKYRKCRLCGERESCVLVLPCRHLCLCGVCGSGSGPLVLQVCPACNGRMDSTFHVILSYS